MIVQQWSIGRVCGSWHILAVLKVVKCYDNAFVVVCKKRWFYLNRKVFLLVFIQGQFVDDLPYHIKACVHKILIHFELALGFSKNFIPFLSIETSLGTETATFYTNKVTAFSIERVISQANLLNIT